MRPKLRFILLAVLCLVMVVMADRSIRTASSFLPPLAKLLSPFSGYLSNAEGTEQEDETKNISDLASEVNIVFDQRRVPHIFADKLEDAVFMNGYLHARDRLWQMDLMTRSASGRLSEILGKVTIPYDRLAIRRGMARAAENAVKGWQHHPESYRLMQAYSAGVNQYLSELTPDDYPIEFKLLDYAPEEWSVYKSALVFKSMTFDLCFRHDDLESSQSLEYFGEDAFNYLYPERMPGESPIIPEGTEWGFEADGQTRDTLAFSELQGLIGKVDFRPMPEEHLGSNNWAVSGRKTRSGHPILANDPHLTLRLPSVWYELEIASPQLHARGVGFPGIPGILIGFNKDIAWGETNGGHDVLDWYKITWTDRDQGNYTLNGQDREAELIEYGIVVKGGKTVREQLYWTDLGPLVYDEAGHPLDGCTMRWIAHDQQEQDEIGTFLRLNQATNHSEYLEAISKFVSPIQNFVFAARDGDIAIKVQGKLPIRKKNEGRFVSDPDDIPEAWERYIPNGHMPHIKNPERGFVSSANQYSTDKDYPYIYYGNFNRYRGRFINDRLEAMDNIEVQDMKELQNASMSYLAREGMAVLLKHIRLQDLDKNEIDWFEKLVDWDLRFRKDRLEPALFDRWMRSFYLNTWDEIVAVRDSIGLLWPERWRTMELADEDQGQSYFDIQQTEELEGPEDVVTIAFSEAVSGLEEALASDPEYTWMKQRGSRLRHMGQIDAFTVQQLPANGYKEALNALGRTSGPSWRMVVELSDPVVGYGVYPGGQSGNPGSPFYDNFTNTWVEGDYYELRLHASPDELKSSTLFQMTCKPKS